MDVGFMIARPATPEGPLPCLVVSLEIGAEFSSLSLLGCKTPHFLVFVAAYTRAAALFRVFSESYFRPGEHVRFPHHHGHHLPQ